MTKIQVNESAQTVADRLRLTVTCVSEMRGAYPDIPLPEDIDREALGEDAFFVTLPIGQAGAKSRNQRRYSRAAVEQMVAQINQQRPEGMWGHVAADEAQTRYDPPAIRWLAAALDAEGIAWGKGLPLTEQTRDYYRLAKATNARVGTSLVAWAQMDGDEVKTLELVTVDLADPARVGVPITAAKAVISKEMRSEGNRTEVRGLRTETSPRLTKNGSASPLHFVERGESKDVSLQASEMVALREMVGGEDVIARVGALMDERAALRDAVITAAVERAVRLPAARGLVEQLVRGRGAETRDEIAEAVAAVVESDGVRAILRAGLVEAMGPAQRRAARREGEGGFFRYSD